MINYNITNKQLKELRDILESELKKYHGETPILLPYDSHLLEILLFDEISDQGKKFAFSLEKELKKIDFSNVSFDNFCAIRFDFSSYSGIKLNPQNLYSKSLYCAICSGVEFIDSFEGVNVRGVDFTGSKNVKINPQRIWHKTLFQTRCTGVEFMGSFDDVNVEEADFTGSKGAKMNPQSIYNKSLYGTKCTNIEFIGPFDGANVEGSNFTGSKNAKINPQTVNNKSLRKAKCTDVEFMGSFDGVDVTDTEVMGSINLPDDLQLYIDNMNFKKNIKCLIAKYNK